MTQADVKRMLLDPFKVRSIAVLDKGNYTKETFTTKTDIVKVSKKVFEDEGNADIIFLANKKNNTYDTTFNVPTEQTIKDFELQLSKDETFISGQ